VNLIRCESCKAAIEAKEAKNINRVKVGRKDFLFIECPKCTKLNKIELKKGE
jgi:uncharacterized protein with PIN domain